MPRFFGYENEVKGALERQGAIVDWFPDRPFDSPALKGVAKISPSLILTFTDYFYNNLLKKLNTSRYDKIFVINGQTLSYKFLSRLRADNPNAELILYMWDSIKNRPNVLKNISLFDNILSFDIQSAQEFGFKHRPLFFSPGFKPSINLDFTYQISFIGTMHSDRYEVISRVKKNLSPELNSYWYFYLQAQWVYHAYRLAKVGYHGSKIGEFNFKSLHKNEVQKIFSKSFSVLDIEHPNQTGLTMRTLETFGAHKKLITTNHSIKDCDLYNANNICVIDRENPKIPSSFFHEAFIPPEVALYEKYSIECWINEIFI